MGKKIFAALIVAVVAILAGYNIYQSQRMKNDMSDLMLANVEALATGEANAGDPCYKGLYDSSKPEAIKCAHPCTKERCSGMIDKCY